MQVTRVLLLGCCCTALAVLAQPAGAQTRGTATTYLLSWEDTDGSKHDPLYEYLDLESDLTRDGSLALEFGGWGRVDLADETDGHASRGEVQYGYIAWHGAAGNRLARLGRQEVTGGAAVAERMDGLLVGGDLLGGFTASAYAGVPLETDARGRGGDLLYGGRVAHRVPGVSEVGLSYLREENDGDESREEEGIDLFLRPHRMVSLDGRSVYSPELSTWMEHSYRAVVTPLAALTLTGDYQRVDYESLFRSTTVSAFRPGALPADEGMRLLGAEAAYEITPAVTVAATWRGYTYDVAGDAHAVGGRLGYAAGPWGAGAGYTRVSGDADRLRYREYRGYATWRGGRAELALEAASLKYDAEIDGRDRGRTFALTAGYALRPALRLVADASYVSDPEYSRDVRGMLKLVYGFAFAGPQPSGEAR